MNHSDRIRLKCTTPELQKACDEIDKVYGMELNIAYESEQPEMDVTKRFPVRDVFVYLKTSNVKIDHIRNLIERYGNFEARKTHLGVMIRCLNTTRPLERR